MLGQRLKIAQVAPLTEAVPPHRYGGTERIVSFLTEEFSRRGHDVTLFASGDSTTRAELVAACEQGLRLDPDVSEPMMKYAVQFDQLMARFNEFDVVHSHLDYLVFPQARNLETPVVTTLHGRLDLRELQGLYAHFHDVPIVSISDAQRVPLPQADFVRTIYHGMPADGYDFEPEPGDYLAFIGRISPEKRVDDAVAVATACDIPIKIAAKVDPVDVEYFESEIKHLFEHPLVEFVGEITEEEKPEFLGNAMALIFMIDWPEPFGLAMIESMACGTPVIARNRGSVPEVVDSGVTGYICESVEEAVDLVGAARKLSRRGVRTRFEERFSVERMCDDYEELYRELAQPGAQVSRRSTALELPSRL